MDSTELHNAQQMLSATNHKLSITGVVAEPRATVFNPPPSLMPPPRPAGRRGIVGGQELTALLQKKLAAAVA